MRDRSRAADRSVDVHFDAFMADDIAMVDRIYRVAGLLFTTRRAR